MHQIWITKTGAPEVLQIREAPTPVPANGEVRIRVKASGVSAADIMGRTGGLRDAPGIPFIPGYEVAGTIDAVAQGATGFKEGDEVLAVTRFGGYSDTVCVPYRQVYRRLEWMSFLDGAALPFDYLTAYAALIVTGSLHQGDRVLIHDAASGVGLAAQQICRIVGAETYGTASQQKHEQLRQYGLDHPIDHYNMDYERVVLDMTRQRGVDIILDPFAGVGWNKNYRLLAPAGRLIHFETSMLDGGRQRIPGRIMHTLLKRPSYTPQDLMRQNKAVAGISLTHLLNHAETVREWMHQIIAWYDEALFRPAIDKTFPFNKAAEAHHTIQSRRNFGKILLTP